MDKPSKSLTEEQKEKHRENARKWAREHQEENRARAREWAKNNPDKVRERYEKTLEWRLEYNRQWRKNNPEKYAAQKRAHYKRHRNGRRLPGGLCDLCGNPETALARRETGEVRALQQDHCHATGVLRGLLCLDCNRLLGAAKDRTDLLLKAAMYLERYRKTETIQLSDGNPPNN